MTRGKHGRWHFTCRAPCSATPGRRTSCSWLLLLPSPGPPDPPPAPPEAQPDGCNSGVWNLEDHDDVTMSLADNKEVWVQEDTETTASLDCRHQSSKSPTAPSSPARVTSQKSAQPAIVTRGNSVSVFCGRLQGFLASYWPSTIYNRMGASSAAGDCTVCSIRPDRSGFGLRRCAGTGGV